MQEKRLDGHNKHYKYLANRIVIEYQQKIHRRIKYHAHTKQSSGIKYIEIPTDNTILVMYVEHRYVKIK